MADKSQIPELKGHEEVADFWDTHSVGDYWDATEAVEMEISPSARRRYLVAIDPDLLGRVQILARQRGLSTESLINLFIEQRLHQLEPTA
ncbi:MAG: CopG family antitoxin [Caldilineaceae bacterium]